MYLLTFGKVRKIQESTKENEANTHAPAGTGLVPQPLDGKEASMTAASPGTHAQVCTHMNTHAWPALTRHVA